MWGGSRADFGELSRAESRGPEAIFGPYVFNNWKSNAVPVPERVHHAICLRFFADILRSLGFLKSQGSYGVVDNPRNCNRIWFLKKSSLSTLIASIAFEAGSCRGERFGSVRPVCLPKSSLGMRLPPSPTHRPACDEAGISVRRGLPGRGDIPGFSVWDRRR